MRFEEEKAYVRNRLKAPASSRAVGIGENMLYNRARWNRLLFAGRHRCVALVFGPAE